jgi:hypothetical protein
MPDGALWLVWVAGPYLHVGSSRDRGRTFSPPVRVNPDPESIDANGEARPKIAAGPRGQIYVSYTRKGDRPFTGDIRFSRRLADGGFAAPITVNDDGLATGHRFDTLAVSPNGDVYLVWIDKRDLERAKERAQPYAGAALYQAVSTDGGNSFSANRKIKDGICECCRLALAWGGETPVLFWRDILEGGIRDHALARLDASKAAARATRHGRRLEDRWLSPPRADPRHRRRSYVAHGLVHGPGQPRRGQAAPPSWQRDRRCGLRGRNRWATT